LHISAPCAPAACSKIDYTAALRALLSSAPSFPSLKLIDLDTYHSDLEGYFEVCEGNDGGRWLSLIDVMDEFEAKGVGFECEAYNEWSGNEYERRLEAAYEGEYDGDF
jgi:hypothetical protein